MKATGIVRRVDELGRVVIPKELRRTMSIEEGDSLEIYVDGASIVLRKFLNEQGIKDSLDVIDKTVQENGWKLGAERTGNLRRLINEMKTILDE